MAVQCLLFELRKQKERPAAGANSHVLSTKKRGREKPAAGAKILCFDQDLNLFKKC